MMFTKQAFVFWLLLLEILTAFTERPVNNIPIRSLNIVPKCRLKWAENFTTFSGSEPSTNHCSYVVWPTSIRTFQLLQASQNDTEWFKHISRTLFRIVRRKIKRAFIICIYFSCDQVLLNTCWLYIQRYQ